MPFAGAIHRPLFIECDATGALWCHCRKSVRLLSTLAMTDKWPLARRVNTNQPAREQIGATGARTVVAEAFSVIAVSQASRRRDSVMTPVICVSAARCR